MADIYQLKDKEGTVFYPQTVASAVFNSTGTSTIGAEWDSTKTSISQAIIVVNNQSIVWQADSTYTEYAYKGTIAITGCTTSHRPDVTFSVAQIKAGNYCPIAESFNGGVYIWGKENLDETVPTITCIKALA